MYVIQISANVNPILNEVIVGKPIILDFDLDFYSTRNPFLTLHHEIQLYQTLKNIYTFNAVPDDLTGDARLKAALESCQQRKELLENLEDLTNFLGQGGPLGNLDPQSDQ